MIREFAAFYDRHRAVLNRIPVINRLPRILRRIQRRRLICEKGTNKNIFTHIYRENLWNSKESASGPGSTREGTQALRRELPALFSKFGIHKIFDAPCGDFHWFGQTSFSSRIDYIGADIVDELVARNQSRYGSENIQFRGLDITADPLPPADLWLCRDCWIHFSAKDVWKSVLNFLRSEIPYLLTTTYTERRANTCILTGEFRPLNLNITPFNFPPPILLLDDPINKFPDKKLGLWSREKLKVSLENHASRNAAV